ncbi:MAG: sulfotransferase [Rudaea sp.]|nr:sulfotransferase [Rudaea sp.]
MRAALQIERADVQDLPSAALRHVREATQALDRGAMQDAERSITVAMVYAPLHPEPRRLLGIMLQRLGRADDAVASLREALGLRPGAAGVLIPLSRAQADANDLPGAIESLRACVAQKADADTLYLLAQMLDRHGELDEALSVLERVVTLDPAHAQARLQYARCLFYSGRAGDAAAQFRHLLRVGREVASAWYGLAEMKTVKFSANDLAALDALCAKSAMTGLERATLLHAVGSAREAAADYPGAFAAFMHAAQLERASLAWNAAAFAQHAASVRAAFSQAPAATDVTFGHEVVFIVGMPRSGSTLIEQILASHPGMEGGSELPDLNLVLQDESARRHASLPDWFAAATPADWRRLGEDYLARTARWRAGKPRFTDKFPGNWIMAEAALAMLPGARIVDCRRDALETCWSCFKQFFAPGMAPWSCGFDELAGYWRECRRHCDHLAARHPQSFRIVQYEALVDDPEGQTRELLAFCDLAFDPACLRSHETARTIRTPSAAQVRQPIRRSPGRADSYGTLLDPLRRLLAQAQNGLDAGRAGT